MTKLEYGDEASRMVEAINTVPDTIGRRQAILRALNLKTGERVLDVGSGPGHQALEMSPMVGPSGKVDGVDISESMLQIARSRCDGVPNVEFHKGDVGKLPFPDRNIRCRHVEHGFRISSGCPRCATRGASRAQAGWARGDPRLRLERHFVAFE